MVQDPSLILVVGFRRNRRLLCLWIIESSFVKCLASHDGWRLSAQRYHAATLSYRQANCIPTLRPGIQIIH